MSEIDELIVAASRDPAVLEELTPQRRAQLLARVDELLVDLVRGTFDDMMRIEFP